VDEQRFGGIARLYGNRAFERIRAGRVCVIGIGGVGSWTVESLARSGVGHITLVDLDDICVTNTNRQLHTTSQTVGVAKVRAMAERARAIAPTCTVDEIEDFAVAETIDQLLDRGFDVVIDAIDDTRNKCRLVAGCRERDIACVVSGGAGGRRDPSRLQIDDLARSGGDGLLRDVRRTLRRDFGFAPDAPWGVAAVFTTERPMFPGADGEVCARPDGTSLKLDCATGFGTASHVTGVVGLAAAGVAVDLLAGVRDIRDVAV
jgi:tRNA A37 threonylcarbamoyladenosine dehydratase